MKKALMIASVASMIDKFNMRNIKILESMGYRVDIAANFSYGSITSQERVEQFKKELEKSGRKYYNIEIPRSIFKINTIFAAYKAVKKLCDEQQYNIVHCHSPIGGVIARLAGRKIRKNSAKILYTAHGFHFYQGAPLKNWLIFYPIEKICSYFTDVLITINEEDYTLALKKMHASKITYVSGIGLDTEKFNCQAQDNVKKRTELKFELTDKIIVSVGEVSERKNHEVIVRALSQLCDPSIKYVICGFGAKEDYLLKLAKNLGVEQQLFILGYRSDISAILNMADIYAFPSLQEGLPVALMEAMSVGKAVVCSKIRGNTDLIKQNEGGFLVDATDADGYAKAIKQLLADEAQRKAMGEVNRKAIKRFDIASVDSEMTKIYASCRKAGE